MYHTAHLSKENEAFCKALENLEPKIREVSFMGMLVGKEWHEASGEQCLLCKFKDYETQKVISLLAIPRFTEEKTIYTPMIGDENWLDIESGDWWKVTLKRGYQGSYVWFSAVRD